jgi:hypothetical protein
MAPHPPRSPSPLRLVVFDATDTPRAAWERRQARSASPDGRAMGSPGLSPIWQAGTLLHRLTRAADASLGATNWPEALAWAAATSRERGRPIASLQVWGHGGWGSMAIGATALDRAALQPGHALAGPLDALRGALAGPESLFWLRCCSAFGHSTGQRFAEALAQRLGCRVAGHTHIIGFFQSGTHSLRPGEEAAWGADEGVKKSGGQALSALTSTPGAPNTVSCLTLGLPEDY